MTNELQELHSQLEIHEKTRKIVEEELRQTTERLSDATTVNSQLVGANKKLEAHISNLTVSTILRARFESKRAHLCSLNDINDLNLLMTHLKLP